MQKAEMVVVLNLDGHAEFLYEDAHPGLDVGEMVGAARVSDVEWDNAAGGWVVNYRPPFHGLKDGKAFARRADAIAEEIRAINAYLTDDNNG